MGASKRRRLTAAILTAVIILASAGAVYAYLSASSGSVNNQFTADQPTHPSVLGEFAGTEKKNVKVDVGDPDYAVYVRAAIVATWEKTVDGERHVYAVPPTGSQEPGVGDYYLDWNESDWFFYDGYYYLKTMIISGATPNLIDLCFQQKAAPEEGYSLNVRIIAQTIQALGTTDDGDIPAVTYEWGVTVNPDKTLSPGTP